MIPRSKGDETRERILNAALECFREKGFEQTTMRDVAARAGMALGAAYYYFKSKDALVMAFYQQTHEDLGPKIDEAIASTRDLRLRLERLLKLKFEYFAGSRKLLAALAAHTDPEHPLSPFSENTRETRERDMAVFARALEDSKITVKKDLAGKLPGILWMYQMGMILFWIHDRSEGQRRTHALVEKSLGLIVRLLQVSSLPLMTPMRRVVLELAEIVAETESVGKFTD